MTANAATRLGRRAVLLGTKDDLKVYSPDLVTLPYALNSHWDQPDNVVPVKRANAMMLEDNKQRREENRKRAHYDFILCRPV